ncbi:MAG TPA: adenylate/guanylate cyclase domain-containing protein, partial [Nitrososphaerales archaeon]|nr:adenylate/guanylate cyclase domain-containing protein [Nitrososphaerales archaeon]
MVEGERRLAAIMFTDIVGYTALTESNESLAMDLLREHREIVRPILQEHSGREIKTIGDAFLVEFSSALEAVKCAFEVQQAMHSSNASRPKERQVMLRIGIHLGDVIEDRGDVLGDAVNIASRIEPLAPPGGISVTEQVYAQVKNKLPYGFTALGQRQVKNVKDPIIPYSVDFPWESEGTADSPLDTTRVAVLPFANFSSDPNDAYFADGITEEIITTVSGVSGLSVISRTSVMGYKGSSKKVREIGKELEVGSVLEGSFRKAGNKIRITTQLIDVAGDKHLWAQNYDRELDDVFAVQSDIAHQVAEALKVRILPHEEQKIDKMLTRNPEAHTLYLKGRYFWNQRTKESMLKAIREYKGAIELDPEFSQAYAGIADCYAVMGNHGHIPFAEAFPKVKEFALKAVEFDPTSGEAHTSLASALSSLRDPSAEDEFKKAIQLNPSYATAHHWYGIRLFRTGRLDQALQEAKKAQELDPLSPQITV